METLKFYVTRPIAKERRKNIINSRNLDHPRNLGHYNKFANNYLEIGANLNHINNHNCSLTITITI